MVRNVLIWTWIGLTLFPVEAMARKRRAVAPRHDAALVLSIVEPNGLAAMTGFIDMGPVSWTPGSARRGSGSADPRRKIALRLERASAIAGGTATVRAWIASDQRDLEIKVNGTKLTNVPTVIDPAMTIGRVTQFTIETQVTHDAAEGLLSGFIEWEATAN